MKKSLVGGLALAVLGVAVGATLFSPEVGAQPTKQAQPGSTSNMMGPKYTIVETEGTNLLVVDNSTNVVYFYTVDPGQEVGADLHLRGSLDLNGVGQPTLRPKKSDAK